MHRQSNPVMKDRRLNLAALIESARVGADALRTNPMRTVLSTTGVIIGVAALVAAFAITDGVDVWSRALIARESSVQDVTITPVTDEMVNGRITPVRGYPILSDDDAEHARAEVPGVMRHALTLTASSPVEYLDMRASAQLTLSSASLADFSGFELSGGRFYTEAEVAHSAPVVVLGSRLAQELAGTRDALWLLGRFIRMGGERREVIGVLAAPLGGQETDLVAFAPIQGGMPLLESSRRPRVATLRLKARSIEAVDSLQRATQNWIAERFGLKAAKLKVEVGTQRLENARQAILLSKLLLGVLVALILAVGGIGIMNVLLAAVVERTREIGIRKAVGARPRDIQAQFLVESVTITGAGSALGFVLGVVLAFVSTAGFRMWAGAPIYPVVKPMTAILAVIAAVTVGVAFGTYPARRAARLSPIEAIARE
ncbi:MAG TPA: ABC transporter permease [Gemmatimonadaceae bacterium]|nr:ABC transporter permease [Gemmatimonadaceae bacterium]